jgi:hypothetical protein
MTSLSPLKRTNPEAEGIPSRTVLEFIRSLEGHVHPMDAVQGFILLRHGNVAAKAWWSRRGDASLAFGSGEKQPSLFRLAVIGFRFGQSALRSCYPKDITKHKLATRKQTSLDISRPADRRLLLTACSRWPLMALSCSAVSG